MKRKIANTNQKAIDYKDINGLKQFLDSYGRVLSRRNSGVTAKYQRSVALAVKRARFMGFIPFIAR